MCLSLQIRRINNKVPLAFGECPGKHTDIHTLALYYNNNLILVENAFYTNAIACIILNLSFLLNSKQAEFAYNVE